MKLFTSLKTKKIFLIAKAAVLFLLLATSNMIFGQNARMAKLSVQLLLNLNGGPNNTADGLVAVFANNFSSAIGNEDSYKFTNLDENIAINRNGTNLSIEGRPTIAAYDTLPMKMWQFRHTSYFFKVDASNFSSSLIAVIKDNFLKTETPLNLSGSTVVSLNITNNPASVAPNRFTILFRPAPPKFAVIKNVKAFSKEHGVQVDWSLKDGANAGMTVIERSKNGKDFEQAISINNTESERDIAANTWFDASADVAADTYYRIKTISLTGEAAYSETAKIFGTNKGMAVYPNPATGNKINVSLNNAEKGIYLLKLLNSMGQSIYSTQIGHIGGTAVHAISAGRQIPTGMYTLQVTKGSFIKSEIVVFK